MIQVRQAEQRGKADFGWLQSRHSFSFGQYYDPEHMGFSALRVINDDTVAAGAGFATHGHENMEIISYVTEGSMEHKDSEGNVQTLPAGEFQLMSAGSGIYHSEYNASKTDPLKFLQIWVTPESQGGTPGYQQKDFGNNVGITPVITPDGADGTLQIKQQARISQVMLAGQSELVFDNVRQSNIYVHLVAGSVEVSGTVLKQGDGAAIIDEHRLQFNNPGEATVTALLFELP